jgi:hypothetical protein
MTLMRTHQIAALVVALVVAAIAATFAFALPNAHLTRTSSPPNDLPYTSVSYSASGASAAFAAVGVRLTSRSKSSAITTLGNRGDALEVDVFGDPQRVKAAGFHDYLPFNGRYVHFPRTCGAGLPDAERWAGNLRVVVHCSAATGGSITWLRLANEALARLST